MKNKDLLNLLNNMDKGNEIITHKHERVLFIDALNLFFRNFSTMNFVNKDGDHIGGLGGFIRSLGYLINHIQPTSVYVIFDGMGSSTNRKNLLPEYKSGRNITRITNWDIFEDVDSENDAKINQISRLIHYLQCLPVKTISLPKSEADDVIAYLSNYMAEKHDSQSFIVSSDKDFLQLINNKITVFRPIEREFFTESTVKEKFGIHPKNFILHKVLLGDNSDKVEGIKGLGSKGLLKKFPELCTEILTMEDIFNISAQKYKEHVVYSRIILERSKLENNYKIMNLANPLIDKPNKLLLESVVEEEIPKLQSKQFLEIYNKDGLGKIIPNTEWWLENNFKELNRF